MAEQVTLTYVFDVLAATARRVPTLARAIRRDLYLTLLQRGKANIVGGVLRDTGPNRDLARYWMAALRRSLSDDGETLTTGLPAADEQARILAHRETGGKIVPKADRPNPHLRIPLDAALDGKGYDKYAGIKLRDLIGPKNPFKLIPTPHAPKATAILVKREEWERVSGRRNARDRVFRHGFGVTEVTRKIKGNQARAWYALVKSMTNAPHPWFKRSTEETSDAAPGVIERRIAAFDAKGREAEK